jgi:ABC-type multidrug transport system fused ATPase/permease subunit
MKLLLRLYDPTDGTIFVNGQDIRTLKAQDLRSCISTLFQDFTVFPLSVCLSLFVPYRDRTEHKQTQIRENIAIGEPSRANDTDLVERAAELGGFADIVNRLPSKLDSYIDHPVQNYFSKIPEGTMSLFGSTSLHTFSTWAGSANQEEVKGLSGGEEQRLAL